MRIRDIQHAGLAASELIAHGQRMVVIHGAGPRIAWFGTIGRESFLFWDDDGIHRRGDWHLRGGHRLWITRPGADESEDTYAPDNAPCRVRRLRDGCAVIAPPDPARIERTIAVRARDGSWVIEHRLRNTGDMLWAGGAWALTCTLPSSATRYRIPLDGGSPNWDVITMAIPRRWGGGHTSQLADRQCVLTDDALEVHARGSEAKRMLWAPRGRLEMRDARGLFVKTAEVQRGSYPLNTNVAIYLGPRRFMVELETMSPIVTLAPGETLRHTEIWAHSTQVCGPPGLSRRGRCRTFPHGS